MKNLTAEEVALLVTSIDLSINAISTQTIKIQDEGQRLLQRQLMTKYMKLSEKVKTMEEPKPKKP